MTDKDKRHAKAKIDAYHLALGRFIHAFADCKCKIQLALWAVSKAEADTARAIFSGAKAGSAISSIRTPNRRLNHQNRLHPLNRLHPPRPETHPSPKSHIDVVARKV